MNASRLYDLIGSDLSEAATSSQDQRAIQGRFDAAELGRSDKEIIIHKGLQENALLKRTDNACCKG